MSVTASNDSLMYQAPATARIYLEAAVENVEKQFGPGSAVKYPEIVAAMITASALDYGASLLAKNIAAHSNN